MSGTRKNRVFVKGRPREFSDKESQGQGYLFVEQLSATMPTSFDNSMYEYLAVHKSIVHGVLLPSRHQQLSVSQDAEVGFVRRFPSERLGRPKTVVPVEALRQCPTPPMGWTYRLP